MIWIPRKLYFTKYTWIENPSKAPINGSCIGFHFIEIFDRENLKILILLWPSHLRVFWGITMLCNAYLRVWLCCVLLNTESDSAVSCSTQSLTLRCPSQHRVWHCGVLLNTESDFAVSCSAQSRTLRCPAQYFSFIFVTKFYLLFEFHNFYSSFVPFNRVSYLS